MAWALSNFNSTQVDEECNPLFNTFLGTVQSALSTPLRSNLEEDIEECRGTTYCASSDQGRDSSDIIRNGSRTESFNKSQQNIVNDRVYDDGYDHDRTVSNEWPFSTQCFMACVSVICCMYSESESESVRSTSRNSKCGCRERDMGNYFSKDSRMYERSFELFQICARLPQNTHAISRVRMVEHEGGASEIIQERAGFGLFLTGSAVNHSCDPNCSVRFHFNEITRRENHGFNGRDDGYKNNEKISNQNILEILANVRLEVVSTRNILGGTECCISYGPLKGKHNKETRRKILEKQYLFSCNCPACSDSICDDEENKEKGNNIKLIPSQENKSKLNELGKDSGPRIPSEENKFLQQNKRNIDDFTAQKQQNDIMSDLIELNSSLPKLRNKLTEIKSKMLEFTVNLSSDTEKNKTLLHNFDDENILFLRKSLKEINDKHFTVKKWNNIRKIGECYNSREDRGSAITGHGKSDTDIKVCRKQLKIFEGMFAEYCSVFCETYDISAHIASLSGKYRDACSFVQDSISGMTDSRSLASYADDDVAVARERVKLAQCMLRAGDRKEWYVTLSCSHVVPFHDS